MLVTLSAVIVLPRNMVQYHISYHTTYQQMHIVNFCNVVDIVGL